MDNMTRITGHAIHRDMRHAKYTKSTVEGKYAENNFHFRNKIILSSHIMFIHGENFILICNIILYHFLLFFV